MVVTGDMGFASTVTFPLGSHWGVVVLRFPNEASVASVNKKLLAAVALLSEEDIRGSIVVLEPGGRMLAAALVDCLRRSGMEANGALIPELLERVRQYAIGSSAHSRIGNSPTSTGN
ncbi:MAG TPA: hypothetical protein GX513_01675 [Firmicutes bacterium]|nr:hypothetical protein [Bacillota bacterium]